jgi:hypothetical protein
MGNLVKYLVRVNMFSFLMFHASYCTLHLMHCTFYSQLIIMHMRVDHAEPKMEIPAEQVQWVFGGSQVPSVRMLTLLLDQGKPRCITPNP